MIITTILPRGIQISRFHACAINTYQVGRASSVNTAIARGIRKSDGFGTSGRRKPQQSVSGEGRYNGRSDHAVAKPGASDEGASWHRSKDRNKSRTDAGFHNKERGFSGASRDRFNREEGSRNLKDRDKRAGAGRDFFNRESGRRFEEFDREQRSQDERPLVSFTNQRPEALEPSRSMSTYGRPAERDSESPIRHVRDRKTPPDSAKLTEKLNIPYNDRNIPLSIPYTTPASEFLYGTSVVQSALTSTRQPRRKLYKLYVLSTPSREDPEQDKKMISLARRAGVTVQRIPSEGVRLLDKMSAGRPHNGYILEASPLPRLPVKCLGVVSKFGFQVELNHQSKEEAEVNGSDTFISTQSSGSTSSRNPLVLYLDSITDPGNLGGIIRTASFLGISAIAISTRNSAPFSPVVLKASAGASENITVFSVEKPAGFIVDSKAAGWKVYAAVAPEKEVDRPSVSADNINDPLTDDPVILMLGSEGEGLRWNLRSKADIDVYIRGSHARGGVDSLNVSVATGILCNAFLRVPRKLKSKLKSTGVSQSPVVLGEEASSQVTAEEVEEAHEQEKDEITESKDTINVTTLGDRNSIF